MTLHICRKLQVMMPVSAGVAHGMQALTKQASALFEGETLVNRAYNVGSGKALIVDTPSTPAVLRVNGVKEGCAVTATGSNNEVQVGAGVVVINGVEVTVTTDAVTATRPATGKYAIYCLSVGTTGATLTATKGTDGDALDWAAYGGAGQMPLCPANEAVVGYMWLLGDTAAPVSQAAISAGESSLIAHDLDPIRGNFILPAALPASYTGAVSRPVYASWYSQDGAVMQPVIECESAKLDIKTSDLNVTPASAQWERHEPGRNSWTATMTEIKSTDNYRLDQALAVGSSAFIKARINSSDSYYFIGKINFTGVALDLKHGELKLPFTFQGTGECCRIVG